MKASFTWEHIRRTNYHHNRRGNSQPRCALTSNTTTINIVMLPPRVFEIQNKTTSVVGLQMSLYLGQQSFQNKLHEKQRVCILTFSFLFLGVSNGVWMDLIILCNLVFKLPNLLLFTRDACFIFFPSLLSACQHFPVVLFMFKPSYLYITSYK